MNKTVTAFSPFTSHVSREKCKAAFTLAEVLITLGIIGVVASMTLPTIIQNNRNIEISSRLKKIYSVMNQAILLSEKDNGPKEYWDICDSNVDNCKNYYEKYFIPYLKQMKTIEFNAAGGYNIALYFNDGSVLVGKNSHGGVDFYFFPNGKWFNKNHFGTTNNDGTINREGLGITHFVFGFYPTSAIVSGNSDYCPLHKNKGFEPYMCGLIVKWSSEQLKNSGDWSCYKGTTKILCTALIQSNGWNIPKDYPHKVK